MPFACLHIPAFPVAAVVRAEPDLRGLAVAVLEGAPPQLTVAAANAQAQAAGVETGMTELEALGHEPSLIVRRRSPQLEAAAQAALLWLAQSVSPRIEATAADTVLLDLSGLDRLLGPPERLARELAQRVAALGLEANIGVAANPDAALHAARGFAGVTVIPAGREAERLGPLPLEVFLHPLAKEGPAEGGRATQERTTQERAMQILETLDRWGVRTFRALAALPDVALAERLGEEGLRLKKLAQGTTSRMLRPAQEDLQFEETLELESAVENLEPLAFVLSRLLDLLCSRLQAHARAAQALQVRLELDSTRADLSVSGAEAPPENNAPDAGLKPRSSTESCSSTGENLHERTLRFPVPLADARVLRKLLQLDLAAHPPPAPVVKVTLRAEPARPRVRQNGLFLPKAPQPEKLEPVLARLAAAGAENAGSPQLLDTHRPGAFRMTRFDPIAELRNRRIAKLKSSPETGRHNSTIPQFGNSTILLALRLFRPPRAARVESRDGQPRRLTCEGIRGTVVWRAGPWRSSGDWWQQAEENAVGASSGAASWMREEWDVALQTDASEKHESTQEIALYRIFRDLIRGKWFVEGEYD